MTVSKSLSDEISEFCSPKIFYPWSDQDYIPPTTDEDKKVLLFWGFINSRINFEYLFLLADKLHSVSSKYEIHLVGPIDRIQSKILKKIHENEKIKLIPPCKLENLDFSQVLASFIPYLEGKKENDVTSIPNKALPMLANGLPILITGMPNFIDEPFVYRLCEKIDTDLNLIKKVEEDFFLIQPSIINFLNQNSSKSRLNQFLSYL